MSTIVIKNHTGIHNQIVYNFKRDHEEISKEGYSLKSQIFIPGSYTTGNFIICALLCLIIIGVIGFIYMALIKPEGTLITTYEKDEYKSDNIIQ